jgi:hypothetical protein
MSTPANQDRWSRRPVGRSLSVGLIALVCIAPIWLFADTLASYRLHSDDFPYLAASRTFPRTISNLFTPHNTHIVPCWRLVTWVVSASAGKLENLQLAMIISAYVIVVTTMLLMGWIVARESDRAWIGVTSMVLVVTTSQMRSSVTWYSAGQTFWAGFGILLTLAFLQAWRRGGGAWRLVLAAVSAMAAGGFWTIGHAAGPVGAVYLWADGRSKSRWAAGVPLLATLCGIVLSLVLGGSRINGKISFHGRTAREALKVDKGVLYTLQAIPENLVLGDLGLTVPITFEQGAVLSLAIAGAWYWSQRRGRPAGPLEWAGLTLALSSYFVEWSFRGYLPFDSLRGVVPWYDTIPHLGAILFLAGWVGRRAEKNRFDAIRPLTVREVAGILVFQASLILVHQSRVDILMTQSVPPMSEPEARVFVTPALARLRAVQLATEMARQQRRALRRLDHAEAIARRIGIDREGIRRAFGKVLIPELPEVYDAADMLDLSQRGNETDVLRVRKALGPYFEMEPPPKIPDELLRLPR